MLVKKQIDFITRVFGDNLIGQLIKFVVEFIKAILKLLDDFQKKAMEKIKNEDPKIA